MQSESQGVAQEGTATLKAGRALDAKVAENVMRWTDIHTSPAKLLIGFNTAMASLRTSAEIARGRKARRGLLVPRYSTELPTAMLLLDGILRHFGWVRLELFTVTTDGTIVWLAAFNACDPVRGDTPAHAVSLAALKAVEISDAR